MESIISWNLTIPKGTNLLSAYEVLYGIRSIDQFSDLSRRLEVGGKLRSVVAPRDNGCRIFLSPVPFQTLQSLKGCLFSRCLIDFLQFFHKWLDVLVGYELSGIAYLMDDAALYLCFGIYSSYGIAKTCQSVHGYNYDILHAVVLALV